MARPRRPLLWSACALLVATAAVAGVAARGAGDELDPRPVTVAEAQRLAMARFNAYESSPLAVAVQVPDGADTTEVHGVLDYRAHRAVGVYRSGTATARTAGALAWDQSGLAVSTGTAGAADTTAPGITATAKAVPARAWSPRAYSTDPMDAALRLTMSLAGNRPDNAQLLAQSGPRRLREEQVDGRVHTVFSGPRPKNAAAGSVSPLTYWVDEQGRLGRVEMVLPGLDRPVRLDLRPLAAKVRVPDSPWRRTP
ncbi:hypothetical protein GCM10010329_58330 [Streptomyces spiroverticillatus]|uniref:DUF3108 domain-containing protein n=1 Tax=Streptomyces finlayi TaxID=67296 RepID=A0A919CCU7_9ACTN|nr:hypothetical protein [Streptomyces finlayi]GHA27432.1 hypothetical protein GCM10010329_58330 [Streptomyces spiroverticillatus]GHD08562.1 hypothetical protein GCM10010334_61990 [Streptomyces finlayi]